ncbi:MAG: TetR/AcrR family transcriptional regulator [Anaerolineae bacterium]
MAQQHRGEETRNRILNAAQECFARDGYDVAAIVDICQAAGVSKGAFYHHFASKQALFLELLQRWLTGLDAQLRAALAEQPTVPAALRAMAVTGRQVFQVADGRLPLFLEFWTKAGHDPEIWQATISPYRRYRDFFAQVVADGIAQGSLRPVDPDAAAKAIVSLAVGLVVQGVLDPEGADWGEALSASVSMLLRGMAQE